MTVATTLSTPGFGHTSVGDLRRALPSAEKQGALRQTAAVGGYPVFTSTPITGESERARSLLPNFNRPGRLHMCGACDRSGLVGNRGMRQRSRSQHRGYTEHGSTGHSCSWIGGQSVVSYRLLSWCPDGILSTVDVTSNLQTHDPSSQPACMSATARAVERMLPIRGTSTGVGPEMTSAQCAIAFLRMAA